MMTSTERLAEAQQDQIGGLLKTNVTTDVTVSRPQIHTPECETTHPYKKMYTLDDLEQTYILKCEHRDHDVVRLYYGYEARLKGGRLVRRM